MKKLILFALVAVSAMAFAETRPTVFGFDLGAPLAIPDCSPNPIDVAATCVEHGDAGAFTIYFPDAKCPALLGVPCSLRGSLVDDNLEEARFFTHGVRDQAKVLAGLQKKYGAPASLKSSPMQTTGGARVQSIRAAWNLPGIRVIFTSATERIDAGLVVIETAVSMKLKAASLDKRSTL